MSANSDARDIIESVQTLAGPTEIDPSLHYVVPVAGEGRVEYVKPDESRSLAPFRPRGTTTAFDVDGFRLLWAKHATADSELFGDPVGHKFTGVLNADLGAGRDAGFRDHRVLLELRKTVAWRKWCAIDGKLLSQADFAEFLEDRLVDVVTPSGADVLELATSLEASTSVEFKSAVSTASGVRQLRFEETQSARAGQTGQLEIPKAIELGVAPFEGGVPFKVTARFRYRINNGHLALGVALDRPEDVEKAAFDGIAAKLGEACDAPVILGAPADPTLRV